MKYIINEDFKLLVSTFMYLYFDIYYLFFDKDVGTYNYCFNVVNKLFNNEYNLYVFERSTDIFKSFIKRNPVLDKSVDVPVSIVNIYSGYKKIKDYVVQKSNSNLDMFLDHVHNGNDSVVVTFIKRFDDINYITPIAFYFSNEDLVKYNYRLDLSQFLYNDVTYRDKINQYIFDIKNFY